MSIKVLPLTLCTLVVLANVRAYAQNQLQITINGSCSTLDFSGRIVSVPLNNQTLLKDYARDQGVTNLNHLGLAYHVGGNDLGDTIEVINTTNGAPVFTLFGLYFGESFDRPFLRSSSGRQLKRIEYIYTSQNSHSLGSALLTDYYVLDDNGNTNTTYVLGQMQYVTAPDATHTNTQVCTASFVTRRPWQFSK